MMRSIIRMPIPEDIDKALEDIGAITTSQVLSYKIFDNLWLSIMIQHHEGSVCPHCGKPIHDYGHGLCRECWLVLKKEMGAIS